MLAVGIVGPAGAGKSTVARRLGGRGHSVLDADRLAHELYVPGGDLVRALAGAFGEDVVRGDGSLDRAALGRIVFSDPAALARLNAIVHPPLLLLLAERVEALRRAGARLAIVEAALLLKWGRPAFVDLLVGVIAPRELRRRRLLAGGISPEDVERRLDAQVTDEELARHCDRVLRNDGSPQALEALVDALGAELERMAGLEQGPDEHRGDASEKG